MYVYKVTFHYIFHQQSFHFKTPKEKKKKTKKPHLPLRPRALYLAITICLRKLVTFLLKYVSAHKKRKKKWLNLIFSMNVYSVTKRQQQQQGKELRSIKVDIEEPNCLK